MTHAPGALQMRHQLLLQVPMRMNKERAVGGLWGRWQRLFIWEWSSEPSCDWWRSLLCLQFARPVLSQCSMFQQCARFGSVSRLRCPAKSIGIRMVFLHAGLWILGPSCNQGNSCAPNQSGLRYQWLKPFAELWISPSCSDLYDQNEISFRSCFV